MNRSAKIALGLVLVGGVTAAIALSSKPAKAAALPPVGPPLPESQDDGQPAPHPTDGVVVVPDVPSAPIGSDPHPSEPVVVAPAPVPVPVLPSVPAVINVPTPNGGSVAVPVPSSLPTSLPPIPMVFDPRLPRPTPTEVLPPLVVTSSDPSSPPLEVPQVANVPSPVPQDTARLVGRLLAEEATGKWKHKDAETGVWQKSRGLKGDGELGPGTALKMAQEIGAVPIVRYWPKGSYKEGKWLREYQQALLTLAASAPEPRASQLRVAADRERGQGFGSQQLPIGVRIELS
jgi:hypothetical protein